MISSLEKNPDRPGNARNGQTANQESDVRDGHVLAQTTHRTHFVAVHRMNDATGAEEQAGLEHGVREQVEHTGHVAELRVVVEYTFTAVSGQRGTEGNHHKGDFAKSWRTPARA